VQIRRNVTEISRIMLSLKLISWRYISRTQGREKSSIFFSGPPEGGLDLVTNTKGAIQLALATTSVS